MCPVLFLVTSFATLFWFFSPVQAEEDAEIEMGDNEMEDVLRHQLSHREVFLSRQYENINANTIR